jgi:glycosyltransferase involved in cell wall biosynthesis
MLRLVDEDELRRMLGERARVIALERYSAERMAEDYLAIYRETLAPRHEARA